MATYTRRNVYDLGDDWAEPILWYARGVRALNARRLTDPLSWKFFAAIHGFERSIWRAQGYLRTGERLPSSTLQRRYWNQCQHGTWYFLPWHRGYLFALEAALRAEIVRLQGPSDWALPYWDYFGPNQNALPPAFASPDWPDGRGNNPLFIRARYGPNDDGNVFVPLGNIDLDALAEPDFTGVASGGSPGFGGVDTGFEHGGRTFGLVESQPHNQVHVEVGGGFTLRLPGLMTDPDTAGLDPIFYLHHANIDRLWEVWIKGSVSEGDPTDAKWLEGPGSVGERIFSMPMPPRGTAWDYTPADVADLARLDYAYDDVSSGAEEAPEAPEGVAVMATRGRNVELVGANAEALRISGTDEVRTAVQLDEAPRRKVAASIEAAAAEAPGAPEADRVFLNLENVTGLSDAATFQVYVNVPEGENPREHPELLAGNVALFGVRKASAGEGHAGGLTFVLEITKIVREQNLSDADVDRIQVRIVPTKPVPDEANISIGRISIFRQGV